MAGSIKPITLKEKEYAKKLAAKRSYEYQHSRGQVREVLAELWGTEALQIPLDAKPGQPPKLREGWGHLSFSHCVDTLLIGWSSKKIGVDIERKDRPLNALKLATRYFSKEEQIKLINLDSTLQKSAFLQQWVKKEAAIKWQRGTFASDQAQWDIESNSKYASHKILDYQIKIHQIDFKDWHIAIACDKALVAVEPIICTLIQLNN